MNLQNLVFEGFKHRLFMSRQRTKCSNYVKKKLSYNVTKTKRIKQRTESQRAV